MNKQVVLIFVNIYLIFGVGANTLGELENEVNLLEQEVDNLSHQVDKNRDQLEDGGKRYQQLVYNSYHPLKDHHYLRLQFLGAPNAWLGCPDPVCDLRTCPSQNNNYRYFDQCGGEIFQIIGDGEVHSNIKSGQRVRFRFGNIWMGCPLNNRCDHRSCPGSSIQGTDFSRCGGEILTIYARGRKPGETIYNGDVVMIYYNGRYIAIHGQYDGDDTTLDFCPGVVPPAYLSYGICSKNAFRIYIIKT